jgi:glycosyltransferase involved in cell wall biosynthesis
MSLTYDFDTILDAIALTPEIGLAFVGEGSQAGRIRESIAARGLTNVLMLGLLPHEQMPAVWHAADACVIALGNHSVADGTRPAKMYEAFATGTPVVAACRGESAVLLETSGGGVVVPLGDSSGMAKALRSLASQPEQRCAMQQGGRAFAEQHLSPERVVNTFVDIFNRVQQR